MGQFNPLITLDMDYWIFHKMGLDALFIQC